MTFFLNVTDTGKECQLHRRSFTDVRGRFLVGDWAIYQLLLHHVSVVSVVCWHLRNGRVSYGEYSDPRQVHR